VITPVSARRVFAVVPAAGRGARFDSSANASPKQYAPLLGASLIEWSLCALLEEPRIETVVVVVAADDERWPALADALGKKSAAAGASSKILSAVGGSSRQESVLRGVRALRAGAGPGDWVLVHDAARPCLSRADVRALIEALDGGAAGAVLAAPIVDTVKRESGGMISGTVDRTGLWRALTPQVFPLGELDQALTDAASRGITVTDEAQAMERLGFRPRLVEGSPFNIKVTRALDLAVASQILKAGVCRGVIE
jgi:2-C-methyl-D-erythritol 4-phosphate cytidylyltransferase